MQDKGLCMYASRTQHTPTISAACNPHLSASVSSSKRLRRVRRLSALRLRLLLRLLLRRLRSRLRLRDLQG
jgi:hypothetical protein